jgi:hypothetical protein
MLQVGATEEGEEEEEEEEAWLACRETPSFVLTDGFGFILGILFRTIELRYSGDNNWIESNKTKYINSV